MDRQKARALRRSPSASLARQDTGRRALAATLGVLFGVLVLLAAITCDLRALSPEAGGAGPLAGAKRAQPGAAHAAPAIATPDVAQPQAHHAAPPACDVAALELEDVEEDARAERLTTDAATRFAALPALARSLPAARSALLLSQRAGAAALPRGPPSHVLL